MCVAIPMQVLAARGHRALCEGRGEQRTVDLSLVGAQPKGTWLLVFLDAARAIVSADEARRVNAALDALEAALAGEAADFDAFFPDLAAREPELPLHLRTETATT